TERRYPCNVSFICDAGWEREAQIKGALFLVRQLTEYPCCGGHAEFSIVAQTGRVRRRPSKLSVARTRRFNTSREIHETSPPSISPIGSERSRAPDAVSRRKSGDISVAAGPSSGRLCPRRRQ